MQTTPSWGASWKRRSEIDLEFGERRREERSGTIALMRSDTPAARGSRQVS